ncbi:tRNA1(Val) (adenine(37)-N6)-methyltransferase [Gymnodinialimonas ceratoperidinii]|uniref:Methyltransferase n=1 Tax=Gymnodinialimonas ceratoperidinii TaxID=2856823 RepID=A0A8F6TW34_9RHOB|nr:methyltransferase [Gymnodinialimonas ceratoperidinii]QXT39740.1 methyltransferase [Gymnodinialimonas ceratoperidinii]
MELTQDGFLGGRVQAWQPRVGYRAATDPVFLAAACPAKPGDTVLELGCGVGVAALCLMARVENLSVTGVERQANYADLARRNGLDVVTADLTALPSDLRQKSYDQIIANPPYYGPGTGSDDAGRDAALREETPLTNWIAVARARLKPGGWLTMIHLAERLPDILRGLDGFGDVAVLPLVAREGRAAGRVLVRARKGARAPFRLLAPLVIHAGASHEADGDDYSATARAILRDGAAVPFG